MLAAVVVLAGAVIVVTVNTGDDRPAEPSFSVRQLRPEPHSAAPASALPAPEDRPGASDEAALDDWSRRLGETIRVPARAVAAYGRAEMWMRSEQPGCQLSWATVAGVGRVESRHGQLRDADIDADGTATTPIVGPRLDGSAGVRAVPDTDGGRLDGDTEWDRAVGPMQFLPQTWQRWGKRASADGASADPQNVDDAAFTAARYLCSGGANLTEPDGWWDAVLTYNQSVSYGQNVFSGADAYATASVQQ